MRRLLGVLALAALVAVGLVVGLANARPEPAPSSLTVSFQVVPDGSDAVARISLAPLTSEPTVQPALHEVVAAGAQAVFGDVIPGGYRLSVEYVSPDVDVAALVCEPAALLDAVDPDARTAVVALASAGPAVCTVTAAERGSVVVKHKTRPSSTRDFEFSPSWGEAVALPHKASTESPPLEPGSYSVTAQAPGVWDTSKARCSDGSTPDAIGVGPGETVTCTFTSTRRGKIGLVVQPTPAAETASVTVNPSWDKKFSVREGKKRQSSALVPGEYSVKVRPPSGWDVAGGQCDDGSELTAIALGPAEKLWCTVQIVQRGRVVVVHEPDAPTSETFTVSTSFGDDVELAGADSFESRRLEPGTYSVSLATPSGWAGTSATCDDGSTPDAIDVGPGETVTCTFASTQPRFTVASFNVLGHSHTERGGHSPQRPSGPVRMGWTMQAFRDLGIDVVGLQEFQNPQIAEFVRQSGGEFALYPSPDMDQGNKQNAVAWRTSEFSLVEGRPVMIPYFGGNLVPMPLVRLRHNETGLEIYVMSVHNAASIPKLGNQSRWRDAAMNQQIALTNELLDEGIPFFMTGDMNERERYFCAYTASGRMQAAAGGSRGGACQPPPADLARIDWVFGSNDVQFSDYRLVRNDLVARSSDHPLVMAEALLLD